MSELLLTINSSILTNFNIDVPLVVSTSRFLSHSWLITGFVTRITRRVPLVAQELLSFRNTWIHRRSLVICVVVCRSSLSFFIWSCVSVPSSIYGFWFQTLLQIKCNRSGYTKPGKWAVMYLFVKSIDYRSCYTKPGKWAVMYLFVKSRSGYTKPGKWAVMYLFVKSIAYRSCYTKPGKWAVMYLFVKSRSGYTKPGKWSVMYLFAKSIDCISFCDFDVWFWNCSDSLICFFFFSFFFFFFFFLFHSIIYCIRKYSSRAFFRETCVVKRTCSVYS
jgi:hypothetical protein